MTKTVVITGASGGIGEAVALALAQKRYNLVLASRNKLALKAVAQKCGSLGSDALVVETDVTQAQAVRQLAHRAAGTFGNIDVWINNAGVILYGRILDVPPDAFQQVLDTNLSGVVYGSRAALQHFEGQGAGTLINIASGFGLIPAPYASSYVASKFAVRGFTASLAQEYYADHKHAIHICCVLPSTIDTPVYQHAGNYMRSSVQAMPPLYSVHTAARKIVRLVSHHRTEVVVGRGIRIMGILYSCLPAVTLRLFARYVRQYNYQDKPNTPYRGNLFVPAKDGMPSGNWHQSLEHRRQHG